MDSRLLQIATAFSLQIATGMRKCDGLTTNCDNFYKVRRLFQIATAQYRWHTSTFFFSVSSWCKSPLTLNKGSIKYKLRTESSIKVKSWTHYLLNLREYESVPSIAVAMVISNVMPAVQSFWTFQIKITIDKRKKSAQLVQFVLRIPKDFTP